MCGLVASRFDYLIKYGGSSQKAPTTLQKNSMNNIFMLIVLKYITLIGSFCHKRPLRGNLDLGYTTNQILQQNGRGLVS